MNTFYIGGKARPGEQARALHEAKFQYFEAVIVEKEDWKGIEHEAEQGLYAISVDIKGKEREQRWKELKERVGWLRDLASANNLGWLYVSVDGFPENIEKLRQLKYESKAIECLPATSPAALDAQTTYPKDLLFHARSAEAKILIDICHLFQTGVYVQALQKPLEVRIQNDGSLHTIIPPAAALWYYDAFQQVSESGYLAPFTQNNGHVFVAEQPQPKAEELDKRIHLPDGRVLKAYGDTSLTCVDWRNKDLYNYYSYAIPLLVESKKKIAQWFRSHTFITDSGDDEMYSVLNPQEVVKQLMQAEIKVMILENNKESAEKLIRDAEFFTRYLFSLS